jgi:anaerobic magnesium-protoporphyrin IX monomethyl ester cyclase
MRSDEVAKVMEKRRQQEKIDLLLIKCVSVYEMEQTSANMGLSYLATYAESKGFKAEILDTEKIFLMSEDRFKKYLQLKNPAVTGFYVISDNLEYVIQTARKIKDFLPQTMIIFGGPLAATDKEKLFKCSFLDGIVTGEGEYSLEMILTVICRNEGKLSDVPGLIYRDKEEIVQGAPARVIDDLDALPYPDVKYFEGQRVFHVVSGRGCPFNCTYCSHTSHRTPCRQRSADNIVDEIIQKLESSPFAGFDFIDDAFFINPDRCRKIAESLIEYKKRTFRNFIFFCEGRVNIIEKHPDLIDSLAQAGLTKLQLGIESADPDVLKAYKKNITPDQVRKTVELVRNAETVVAIGGFIIGGPGEDEKAFKRTVDLAVELIEMAPGAFAPSAAFLGAYPGTKIAEDPAEFGLKMVEPDFIKLPSLSDVQFVNEFFDTKDKIRNLKMCFEQETNLAMLRALPKIPRKLLFLHYLWMEKYGSFTLWYNLILSKLETIRSYFKYLRIPRFKSLDKIPESELPFWKPMRVMQTIFFNPDGTISLPPSTYNLTLKDREEILAYELSTGKLNLAEIAERIKHDLLPEKNENEIISNVLIPLYHRLDQTYHVLFYL